MVETDQSKPQICQLKITLVDSEPEVWRQVLISADVTLIMLHRAIQQAMGWEQLHDYRFVLEVGKASLGVQQSLHSIAQQTQAFYYTYDFQSGWLHRIEIEASAVEVPPQDIPLCIGGEAACPPEETGGVWGYDELLARLEDTDDPDYLALIEKYGSFDPDKFDMDAANRRLAAQP